MKTFILFISIFLTGFLSNAQEVTSKPKSELDVSYYSTDIGHNISVEYNKNVKKHTFIIGLKCHLNQYIPINGPLGGYAYHKQFYADNFMQYFGASVGYEYHLKDINPYVSPYLLFNSQYANMKTKYRSSSENITTGVVIHTMTDGPFVALENTIGVGLSIKLNDRFSLNQSAGIGSAFFLQQSTHRWDWEMMYQWRMGISVKLN